MRTTKSYIIYIWICDDFFSYPLSPCKSGVDALMLLWLAILLLLAMDLVDDDPTLFAECILEKVPIGITGKAVLTAVIEPISVEGVFSPNSQYVVILPLPCEKLIFMVIEMPRIFYIISVQKLLEVWHFNFSGFQTSKEDSILSKCQEVILCVYISFTLSQYHHLCFWKRTI